MTRTQSRVQIRVRALAHGGAGLGRPTESEGPTWFIPGTLPDELVEAEPVRTAKRFVHGQMLRVLEPSADRVSPPCPLADRCGGCDWQHVRADKQAEFKARIVAGQLRELVQGVRVGFAGTAVGYRRRARLSYANEAGEFRLGFLAKGTHAVVELPDCGVLARPIAHAVRRVREATEVLAGLLPPRGELLALTDGTQVVLGVPKVKPQPEVLEALANVLDGTLVGVEVRGARQRAHVGQRLLEIDGTPSWPAIRIGAFAFGQANAAGNRALVEHVARMAQPAGARVLELYAGSGNLSRALARTAKRVWASDSDADAIATLQALSKSEQLPINAKRQRADRLLPKLAKNGQDYEVIVVDPPRAGLGEDATAAACRVATQRIVYVSCDAATLARDLRVATSRGFVVDDVTVFDLMPMTSHAEIVATFVPRAGVRSPA